MPLMALATMSGRMKLTTISCTAALAWRASPARARIRPPSAAWRIWVARPDGVLGEPLERGWLNALPRDEGVVVLLLEQDLMKSLASETFFENFQIASELTPVAQWMPAGPAGLLWWLISSAIGMFLTTAAT